MNGFYDAFCYAKRNRDLASIDCCAGIDANSLTCKLKPNGYEMKNADVDA